MVARWSALLCLAALALAADPDPYAAWWRRADAALAAADAAGRERDPPPAAAGGPALVHHRLLAAWLSAPAERPRLGGVLAAVRAAAHGAVRILDPSAPLAAVPDAGEPTWQPEALGGPDAWREFAWSVAARRQAVDQSLVFAIEQGWSDAAIRAWTARQRAWEADPVAAAAEQGTDRAPPAVPAAEAEAVRFLAVLLNHDEDAAAWASPAAQVFRYRVRRDCHEAWWAPADQLSDWGARLGSRQLTASGRELAALVGAALSDRGTVGLFLPVLAGWQQRLARQGGGDDPRQAFALLGRCGDDPAAAAREHTAFQRHLAELARSRPEGEMLDGPGEDADDGLAAPHSAEVVAALATATREIAGLAAANHAVGKPLAEWSAAEVADAKARLAACTAGCDAADGTLAQLVLGADQRTFPGVTQALARLQEALAAQAETLSAADAASRHRRDAAVAEAARSWSEVVADLPRLVRIVASCGGRSPIEVPPLHLGIGADPPPAPAGWSDDSAAADAMIAVGDGPARVLADHLVALRRGGASAGALRAAWERAIRRRDAYRALAGRPDLDLLAQSAADRAPVAAAMIAAARSAAPLVAEPDLRGWIAAACRPSPGRMSPAGGRDRWAALETMRIRAADLGGPWPRIALWIHEGGASTPERIAILEQLVRVRIATPALQAAARVGQDWARAERRPVVRALIQAAATGWTGAGRMLAAARTYGDALADGAAP